MAIRIRGLVLFGLLQLSIVLVIATLLSSCGGGIKEPEICYSKFTHSGQLVSKSPFLNPFSKLQDNFIRNYSKGDDVLGIPIASGANIYLASTCNYVALIRRDLDKHIEFMKIPRQEYENAKNISSQSGLVIDAR